MSEPRLHFRLVDDRGQVLVDEDVWVTQEHAAADRHGELARRSLDAGRTVTLTVTDPDGDIPTHTFVTRPTRNGGFR
jgi:hypothetical protein